MPNSLAAWPRIVGLGLALAVAAPAARAADAPAPPPPSPRFAAPVPPPPSPRGVGAGYGAAFVAADAGKWTTAFALAAGGDEPLADKVLHWLWLVRGDPLPPFDAIADFVAANPDWPETARLRRRAEAALDDTVPDARVTAWFADHPPATGPGKARLAAARLAAGDAAGAAALVRDAWIDDDFAVADERAFVAEHGERLRPRDHAARLDRLLWDGKWGAARRMLPRVDAATRRLAEARIKLMRRAGGVDAAIARVPPALRADPGLVYERLRWRRRKGLDARARDILLAKPDDLVRPAAWWTEARIGARRALDDGLVSAAYRLAGDHRQEARLPVAEAEWLAGWIALRFLDDPDLAYPHFALLHAGVRYPISVARAAYWAGRAAAAAGDRDFARHWYEKAARFPTTYHGQLALAALGRRGPLPLPPEPPIAPRDVQRLGGHELMQVVRALARIGRADLSGPFVRRLAELAATPGERRLVAEAADAAGRPDLALAVARRSARHGTMLIEHGFPVLPLPASRSADGAAEPALLLAMLRQESGFDLGAVSRAGARGLMQLMPGTARAVAGRLGLPYSRARLTADESYNLTLGRAYLEDLLAAFDRSYVLALAAYNAGPRRVKRWIRDFGDPRTGEVDVVDWIELVPYAETRNYVQRVIEAVPVYRRVLGRDAPVHSLILDLNRAERDLPG